MKSYVYWSVILYLRFWARISVWFGKPKIIGITGSVGKSSCRDIIYAAIKDHVSVKVIEKGNSEIGIPLGLLGLTINDNSIFDWIRLLFLAPFGIFYLIGTNYLIIEYGIDEPDPPKNMGYLLTIVQPDIAVFLNVYPVHTMQFDKTIPSDIVGKKRIDMITKKIAQEKGQIITELKAATGIINNDDINIKQVTHNIKNKIKLLTYGKDRINDVYYDGYKLSTQGVTYHFYVLIHKSRHRISINIKKYLLPEVYREVVAASLLAGISLNIPLGLLVQSIEQNFTLPAGRASVFEGINNSIIIDSSYNASRAAVLTFLDLVVELKKQTQRPVVFVFGDMRELGKETETEHLEVAKKISGIVDYLYCVGKETEKYVVPNVDYVKEKKWFPNSIILGQYLKDNIKKDSIILFKGSQNTIFLEEAIKYVLVNKDDEKKLCRQSEFWMKKKNIGF